MPGLSEETARHYRFAQLELRRWRAVRDALIDGRPSERLRALIDQAIAAASAEHRAAERHLFDIFDLMTSDLLEDGAHLGAERRRAELLARQRYHENVAEFIEDTDHADMHRRLAEQLHEVAAAIEAAPPAAPRRRASSTGRS